MQNKRTLLSLCALIGIALVACRPSPPQLDAAERVVGEHPDSTLRLLAEIESPSALAARDYARYALISTKARYNLNYNLIADTLLDLAVNYYKKHPQDSARAYEAYYYAGQIARMRKEPEKAMTNFLEAKNRLAASRDLNMHYVIETWIGVLSGEQGLYQRKIMQARTALKYADSLGDDNYRSISLGDMAHGFLGLMQYDSVTYYAREGLRFAEQSGIAGNIAQKLALLSEVLIRQKKYQEALPINIRSTGLADSSRRYGFYIERAHIFNRLGQYDSALVYLNKSRTHTLRQKMENRALRYQHYADAYNGLGQKDSAYVNLERYCLLVDSVYNQTRTIEVLETEQIWKHGKLKEENLLLRTQKLQQKQWIYRIFLLSGAAILVIGCCYFGSYRRNKTHIIRQQQEIIHQHELLQVREQEKQQADCTLAEMRRKEERLRSIFFKQLSLPMVRGGNPDSPRTLRLTDSDWKVIFSHADAVFDNFTLRLQEYYPALNEEDLRFCCMVKMQLSQAEIAEIVCLEKDSVKKRLKRIRLQKMGATEGTTLEDVLRNF